MPAWDPEPPRDPRYPSRYEDPAWRQWRRRADAPLLPPPGRPSVDGWPGTTPQVSVRLPAELRARAVHLARWRRTSLAVVVRQALEHYLDEGVGGRAGRPKPQRFAPPRSPPDPQPDIGQAYADADTGVVAAEE